jgi:tRNA A-37 threonylcarbamoyl transferase component Bud32
MPRFVSVPADAGLLALEWSRPLAEWSSTHLIALPRGISRHVVRFVRLSGQVYALKEAAERYVLREAQLLRELERLDVPAVEPVGVVLDRFTEDREPLDPILLTRHLSYSLPYRAVFSRTLRSETVVRLVDALAALLVRLHLAGFFWGDCSLSNTLFRRDAGAFAAYLVDAETGELHDQLSTGQRAYDLDIAHTNIFGELLDLQAGGYLSEDTDLLGLADTVVDRYQRLWAELTEPEEFNENELYRLEMRIKRLNDLGFDVAELDIHTDIDGQHIRIQPKVVDAGHHSRRLLRLTGLDVEENQARRLLNDLDTFRAATQQQYEDEEIVAHQWLTEVFEPVIQAVPAELRGKLQPAEIFHEVLEHRWYRSEEAGHEIPLVEAARSYAATVLRHRPDERERLASADELGSFADADLDA